MNDQRRKKILEVYGGLTEKEIEEKLIKKNGAFALNPNIQGIIKRIARDTKRELDEIESDNSDNDMAKVFFNQEQQTEIINTYKDMPLTEGIFAKMVKEQKAEIAARTTKFPGIIKYRKSVLIDSEILDSNGNITQHNSTSNYDKLLEGKLTFKEAAIKLKNTNISNNELCEYIQIASSKWDTGNYSKAKTFKYFTIVMKELVEREGTGWCIETIADRLHLDCWDFFQSIYYVEIDFKSQYSYNSYCKTKRPSHFDAELQEIKNRALEINTGKDTPSYKTNNPYGEYIPSNAFTSRSNSKVMTKEVMGKTYTASFEKKSQMDNYIRKPDPSMDIIKDMDDFYVDEDEPEENKADE